ncbi:MAG: DUF4215 domain-containing protein, partial [Myxococcota bacterium]|nr:DUF4215 domain-containing protein [Myxococcota bacterium]
AGDGCSSSCTIEFGFTCSGEPSSCQSSCGDGKKASNEACDDGNNSANDGCTSCAVDFAYQCSGNQPSVCAPSCGDGLKAATEACDDGNGSANDGCTACAIDFGFACTGLSPSVCSSSCGDGKKASNEGCDDGNPNAGDGCSACVPDFGFNCVGTQPSVCSSSCGDGKKASTEACDDGNTTPNDGCTSCVIDFAYTCSGTQPSLCASSCGDGKKANNEACDDGNLASGDGCTACAIDFGYACSGTQPSLCLSACGDGKKASNEACDDGNVAPNDGCSACVVDFGYACTGTQPSVCSSSCGDGFKAANEACDDGNTTNGDGCTGCTIDAGYNCVGTQPSVCSAACGDGSLSPGETCDDGNTIDGDCCSSSCQLEAGCETEPNNTVATANPIPLAGGAGQIKGSVRPVADQDYFRFTLSSLSDVRIETFDGSGSPTCSGTGDHDTWLELIGTDGSTVLVTDDDGGEGVCSLISAPLDSGARQLSPGDYTIHLRRFSDSTEIPLYRLTVNLTSVCGDGLREGYEGCDDGDLSPGDGCSATCTVEANWLCTGDAPSVCTPTLCGNSALDVGEQCDDGNLNNADGCSSSCQVEPYYQCRPELPSVCVKQETNCNDSIDNDGDGQMDLDDSDCVLPSYFPACGAGQARLVYRDPMAAALTIPDETVDGVVRTLYATLGGTVRKVSVLYDISHIWISDIDLFFTPPGSSRMDVCTDNGGAGDNYTSTLLDSTCGTLISAGSAPFTGCYQPETAFTPLNGSAAQGPWVLSVSDDEGALTGTLKSWALVMCVEL